MPAKANPTVIMILLGLTAVGAAAAAHAAVFGRDDRAPVRAGTIAKSVGTLARRGSAPFCTAFCVAPDVIATAGHCLNGSDVAAAQDLSRVNFRLPASGAETPIAGSAIGNTRQNIIAGAAQLRTSPPIAAATDWAIARLAAPICSGTVVRLSPRSNTALAADAAAGRIDQIAFHRDRPDAELTITHACRAIGLSDPSIIARDFATPGALIFHDCDTGNGSSGSPLLSTRPEGGEPEVVAISIGTYVLSKTLVTAGGETENPNSKPVANTAVRIAALLPALDDLQSRDLLESPDDIRRLERALKRLGFYSSPVIGYANATLMNAVRDFESAKGRKPTGLLRRTLLKETWDEMDR